MSDTIELLAPAKDGPTARVAIQCSADAVYLGAPRFGTREAAGNTISAIEKSRPSRTSIMSGCTSP